MLSFSDSELEYHHDYIQTLFPLPERSPFNPSAPLIDRATFLAFRSQPALQDQLRLALDRMLRFYGFELQFQGFKEDSDVDEEIVIIKGGDFSSRKGNWVRGFNHNHLRITRILRSLRVLGLEDEAKAFFGALEVVYGEGGIGEKSLVFWRRAVERELWIRPEDEGVGRRGWLWEEEQRRRGGGDIGGET